MLMMTTRGKILCDHKLGQVKELVASHPWVRIDEAPVLVKPDPAGRSISGCPNIAVGIKPCTTTLAVTKGYSSFVRIDGIAVCLGNVGGLTDGSPPGVVEYQGASAGQDCVRADA